MLRYVTSGITERLAYRGFAGFAVPLFVNCLSIVEDEHDEWEEVEPDGEMEYSNGLVEEVHEFVLNRSNVPEA